MPYSRNKDSGDSTSSFSIWPISPKQRRSKERSRSEKGSRPPTPPSSKRLPIPTGQPLEHQPFSSQIFQPLPELQKQRQMSDFDENQAPRQRQFSDFTIDPTLESQQIPNNVPPSTNNINIHESMKQRQLSEDHIDYGHGIINSVVVKLMDPVSNVSDDIDAGLYEDSASASEQESNGNEDHQQFKHTASVLSLSESDESDSSGYRKDSLDNNRKAAYNDELHSYSMSAQSRPSISETDASSIISSSTRAQHSRKDKNSLDIPPQIPEDGYTLMLPPKPHNTTTLEDMSEKLFSSDHLSLIIKSPSLLRKFTKFITSYRPATSLAMLKYYLDGTKALRAVAYTNAIKDSLKPIPNFPFTNMTCSLETFANQELQNRVKKSFDYLVEQELPRYITSVYSEIVNKNIFDKITGQLSSGISREVSESLAEVFCLTDPSRPDNAIIMASEEFHRTTQYGVDYVVDRNCRFLQGPGTSKYSVRRLSEAIRAGQEVSEVFLNYRRDGSPFMNLLMVAPLCDSKGNVRYFLGAQCDVTQLVKEHLGLESFRRLMKKGKSTSQEAATSDFEKLAEYFDTDEIDAVRTMGGRLKKDVESKTQGYMDFRGHTVTNSTSLNHGIPGRPRVVINGSPPEVSQAQAQSDERAPSTIPSSLNMVYKNYLLVRPFPSLNIIFASPSMRTPGILQSPFLSKIGGSDRVRNELETALIDGRGVTAKIRWLPRSKSSAGRERWIHCTPLLAQSGGVGIWMIVVLDEEKDSMTIKQSRKIHRRESWAIDDVAGSEHMPDMRAYERRF